MNDAQSDDTPVCAKRGPGTNTGHGHVWPRPDKMRARCGGRLVCTLCKDDFARYGEQIAASTSAAPDTSASANASEAPEVRISMSIEFGTRAVSITQMNDERLSFMLAGGDEARSYTLDFTRDELREISTMVMRMLFATGEHDGS